MGTPSERILRNYPDFPKIQIGDVAYEERALENFLMTVMGMYFAPTLEELHGQIEHIAKIPKLEVQSQNPKRDFLAYNLAITLANIFGLAMPSPTTVRPEDKIFPRNKFPLLVDQLSKPNIDKNVSLHGATLGAYDAAHPFHTLHWRLIYPQSTHIFVGIEPDWLLSKRKGSPGDERPRYPLLYRMWQIACLPMIDAVFELPIEPGQSVGDVLPEVWDALDIKLIHTESDHEFIGEYRTQMESRGGRVDTTRAYPWWAKFLQIRSSANERRLSMLSFSGKPASEIWNEKIRKRMVNIESKMSKRWSHN